MYSLSTHLWSFVAFIPAGPAAFWGRPGWTVRVHARGSPCLVGLKEIQPPAAGDWRGRGGWLLLQLLDRTTTNKILSLDPYIDMYTYLLVLVPLRSAVGRRAREPSRRLQARTSRSRRLLARRLPTSGRPADAACRPRLRAARDVDPGARQARVHRCARGMLPRTPSWDRLRHDSVHGELPHHAPPLG